MSNVEGSVESIPEGFTSSDVAVTQMRYAFIVGIAFFIISLPFCRSRKGWCDAIAARKVSKVFRTLVFCELLCLIVLFYFYLSYGNPVYLHAALSFGNGDSWVFGYGRPSAGVIFIGLGLYGALMPVPRMMCMIGCVAEIVGDMLSAYQIHDYYYQVKNRNAPSHGYSLTDLKVYYWRDIVSIGMCAAILLYATYLSTVVGWCDPQIIRPSEVTGQELDRVLVLHQVRGKRKYMEQVGIVAKPVLPVFHRHIEDFTTDSASEEKKKAEEAQKKSSDSDTAEKVLHEKAESSGKPPNEEFIF
eukprot:gene10005-11063_t